MSAAAFVCEGDCLWQSQQRQNTLLITSVIMVTMAFIFVVLRCVSRFILIRNPGPDDYLMIGAMVLTIGYLADIFIMRDNKAGFPMMTLSLDNMVSMLKTTLSIEVMYYGIIFCIKNSIVFTYLRFAVSPRFRQLCIATIVIHSVFFVMCVIVTLAQCRPLEKMWDMTFTVVGTCINTTAFFYTTSGFNIITDVWIIALPVPTLRSINRPGHEKIALFCIFGIGTFAAVASIVRLHSIYQYTEAEDPFRDSIPVNLWSVIEVTIAISCASVSALKPIFSSAQRQRSRTAASGSGGMGGASGGSDGSHGSSGHWRRHRLGSKDQSHDGSETLSSSVRDAPFPTTAPLAPLDGPPVAPTAPLPPQRGGYDPREQDSYRLEKMRHNDNNNKKMKKGSGDRMGEASSEEESMIVFTPLSPPPRQSQTEDQLHGLPIGPFGHNELSSSGSVFILQKN